MAAHRTTPGFFFARGFLGVCGISGAFGVVLAISRLFSDAPVSREVRGRGREASVDEPSTWLRLLDASPMLLQGLLMLAVGFLLLVVVVDIQRGVPFEAKSARRLRFCAGLVGLGAPAWLALSTWADLAVLDAARAKHGRGFGFYFLDELSLVMPWFLVAALFAVFAHAFTAGRQLADDSEGLV